MPRLRARRAASGATRSAPSTYRTITAVALVALGAIVVSGAAVRLTGSGMGCPTWPTCEDGSLVPRGATGANGWIEFVNRTFTGAGVGRGGPRRARRPAPRPAPARPRPLVVGARGRRVRPGAARRAVVVLHVTPLAVAGHYLLSAVLVANAVVLHHKAGEPDGHRRRARATPAAAAAVPRRSSALAGARAGHRHARHRQRAPQRRRRRRPPAVRGRHRRPRPQR